ncbi:hypothetical protein ACFV7R_45205 [Streptomyces sp. NPDC059866]|uniref:hypothetical protein n=1 Tax=Streptomyces sp. NPDC059866 TaxID=3346978 RepID=UPI003652235A
MAAADEEPSEIDKQDVPLSGGRTLRVTEYSNGSIQIAVKTGSPYVITSLEQIDNEAVLKISPDARGRMPTRTGSVTTAGATTNCRRQRAAL